MKVDRLRSFEEKIGKLPKREKEAKMSIPVIFRHWPGSRRAGFPEQSLATTLILLALLIPSVGMADQDVASNHSKAASMLIAMSAGASGEPKSLHEAIERRDMRAIDAFIAGGADPNGADKTGARPLYLAMKSGSPEMVQKLIAAGADVKASDERAPLMWLAGTNRPLTAPELEIAQILIRSGARVDARGINQKTPLHQAATYNHAGLIKILLEKGADPAAKESFSGGTPLHVACEGVPEISAQGEMVRRGALETVDALLRGGARPNARDKYGVTPLHTAARFLQLHVADRLIAAGADIQARTDSGWTPLHFAAVGWNYYDLKGTRRELCDEQVFRLLVLRGADANAKDPDGKTPSAVMNRNCVNPPMPQGVRAMGEKLKAMNRPALLPTLVQGLTTGDAIAIVGPNHGFETKACVLGNAVAHAAIYKYWEDGAHHRLYFKIPPPRDMVLDIAGLEKSTSVDRDFHLKSTRVTVPGDSRVESGSLAQYERNGELRPLPALAIDPKRTVLRFFESGSDVPPYGQRKYGQRFARPETRIVNWELQLAFADPKPRRDFVIHAVYHKPDGSVLSRSQRPSYGEAGWKGIMQAAGVGWKEAGRWQAGTYRVELNAAGQKIAEGSFEVH